MFSMFSRFISSFKIWLWSTSIYNGLRSDKYKGELNVRLKKSREEKDKTGKSQDVEELGINLTAEVAKHHSSDVPDELMPAFLFNREIADGNYEAVAGLIRYYRYTQQASSLLRVFDAVDIAPVLTKAVANGDEVTKAYLLKFVYKFGQLLDIVHIETDVSPQRANAIVVKGVEILLPKEDIARNNITLDNLNKAKDMLSKAIGVAEDEWKSKLCKLLAKVDENRVLLMETARDELCAQCKKIGHESGKEIGIIGSANKLTIEIIKTQEAVNAYYNSQEQGGEAAIVL
jgi:hypothetical protein